MSSVGRYGTGCAVAAGLGGIAAIAAPPEIRKEVCYGVLIGLALQGPLGWWVLRALGSDRFTVVWGVGMLIRLAVLGLVALVAVPALGWAPGPVLLTLVVMLGALLAVESFAAAGNSSQG